MLKTLSLFLILFLSVSNSFSQKIEDLFTDSETKVTWLGIDFSHVKLIGEFNDIPAVKNTYFDAWNELILNEYNKYDIGAMLRHENIKFEIESIKRVNDSTNIKELEALNEPDYTVEQLEQFVANIEFTETEGIGILFLAESLNKRQGRARYHCLIINLTNNKVMLVDTLNTTPGGFGFRNYWARSYYNAINEIRDKKYKRWKNLVMKK